MLWGYKNSFPWYACGGLTLAGGQVDTKATLSLPSSAGQGRGKYNKRLMGRDKHRQRWLTDCHHRQNRLGEINLIYYQSNQSRIMRNKLESSNTFPPPPPSSWAWLHSQFSLPPASKWHRSMGNGLAVSSSHISAIPSSSGAGLLTLFPCSSIGSLPRETVLHELLQCGSLPQGVVLWEQTVPAWVPCGVTSPTSKPAPAWAPLSTGPARSLLQHGLPMGSQLPSGIHLLRCGVVHKLHVDICSTVDLHGCRGTTCLTMVFHHKLQGNTLCSGISSISCPLRLHWPSCLQSSFLSLRLTPLSKCRLPAVFNSPS